MFRTMIAAVAALTLVAGSVQASLEPITIEKTPAPAGDTLNVLFNRGDVGNVILAPIQNTSLLFRFTSGQVLETAAAGQARIEGEGGGSFTDIEMQMDAPLTTFPKLTFNLRGSGDVEITAWGLDDVVVTETFTGDQGLTQGQNFFLVLSNPEPIHRVGVRMLTGQIDDIRQVRVIPLPPALWAAGMMLGAMGIYRRLRRRPASV